MSNSNSVSSFIFGIVVVLLLVIAGVNEIIAFFILVGIMFWGASLDAKAAKKNKDDE